MKMESKLFWMLYLITLREGNENGPFFSFKGFDNNIYYLLTPEGNYYNFSGCGEFSKLQPSSSTADDP